MYLLSPDKGILVVVVVVVVAVVIVVIVGVYSEDMKEPCMILTSLASGVTHLAFSPDGHTLYSGFRKASSLKPIQAHNGPLLD